MSGKIIVLEGIDGCGKATQAELLQEWLQGELNQSVPRVSFPQYDEPSSALVKQYLNGDFGKDAHDVSPFAASTFYAVDRYASYKTKDWGRHYDNGGIVIADRYSTSNAIFQSEKVLECNRALFMGWLMDLEHNRLGIPKPDVVIYLDVPVGVTSDLVKGREAKDASRKNDIHEENLEFMESVN